MNLLDPGYAGRHVEQVLDGDRPLALVKICNRSVWKQVEHRPIDALQLSVLHQEANCGAHETFGHGAEVVPDTGDVGRIVGVGNNPSVPNDQHAVVLVGADIVDQARDRA